MSNSTKKAENRRISTFLGARRKFFLNKRKSKSGFQFLKINKGSLSVMRMPFGSYRATFSSAHTGRHTFAYGETFATAYRNLVRLFYLKYSD